MNHATCKKNSGRPEKVGRNLFLPSSWWGEEGASQVAPMFFASNFSVHPFSQKSRTRTTVAKEFQSGLYDPAEADFELFCNCCSAGFLGDRLYYCTVRSRYKRIV